MQCGGRVMMAALRQWKRAITCSVKVIWYHYSHQKCNQRLYIFMHLYCGLLASDTVQSGRRCNILPVSSEFNIQDCQHMTLQLRQPQQLCNITQTHNVLLVDRMEII